MLKPKMDIEDRFGRYPLRFPKSAKIADINEYLFHNYPEYQFCIYFRFQDDFADLEEIDVYFADEILPELATFIGKEKSIQIIQKEAT